LFSPFGYFKFYFLVLVGSLLWSLKKKEELGLVSGLVLSGGYFIFCAFFFFPLCFLFFLFPFPVLFFFGKVM